MSWEVQVEIDADKVNVGLVRAIWTDPDLSYGTFSLAQRIEATATGANAFVAEAIAARDAWQLKQADRITKTTYVLNRFNTTDPKV